MQLIAAQSQTQSHPTPPTYTLLLLGFLFVVTYFINDKDIVEGQKRG
jgi:hypothetical protein